MKVAGRDAKRFCAGPPGHIIGALLSGDDAGLIAARRRTLVDHLTEGDAAMRLTELDVAEARRDAARIDEAMRARGFFPGRRVVVIEGGTDGLAKPLSTVLAGGITPEDAFLVVTAGILTGRSSLKKLFEGNGDLAAVACQAEVPGPQDTEPQPAPTNSSTDTALPQ